MSVFGRVAPPLVGMTLLFGAAGAWAQTNAPVPPAENVPTDLTEGKTAAQLFEGGCSVCHNRPQGLAKDKSARTLSGFLRQHYTSSIQNADALASYLASAGPGAATPPRRGAGIPGAEPAAVPRRGGEASAPAFEIPSATNPRRVSVPTNEPAGPGRPPRRVPDTAARPDAKPDSPAAPRRPASAEAPKPAASEARPEAKPEIKPAPKPTLEEIFD